MSSSSWYTFKARAKITSALCKHPLGEHVVLCFLHGLVLQPLILEGFSNLSVPQLFVARGRIVYVCPLEERL